MFHDNKLALRTCKVSVCVNRTMFEPTSVPANWSFRSYFCRPGSQLNLKYGIYRARRRVCVWPWQWKVSQWILKQFVSSWVTFVRVPLVHTNSSDRSLMCHKYVTYIPRSDRVRNKQLLKRQQIWMGFNVTFLSQMIMTSELNNFALNYTSESRAKTMKGRAEGVGNSQRCFRCEIIMPEANDLCRIRL